MRRRIQYLLSTVVGAFVFATQLQASIEMESLAGEATSLEQRAGQVRSLALIVEAESELLEAQRLLTLAESVGLQTFILVALPEGDSARAATIRLAARRFFKSDFSRSRVFLIFPKNLDTPGTKTLLIQPDGTIAWTGVAFPNDEFIVSIDQYHTR